ncbi:MAG: phage tail protein [Sphingomonas sp.]
MATLVLGTIGSVFGPVGRAVGSLIGNVIDREILFKPAGREGPRLTELALQTSSYGAQIPKLFGTMRVAGSVIWATDLIEHRSKEGGKGRPTVTNYSYTASFAVALSGRGVLAVGRIWADGKLLRGSAGDWKSGVGAFRLHPGDEDQAADPLIAAAEGAGNAPAHRGIAYAVFEDLELGEFGNRIPALTFEVQADTGAVAAGDVMAELAGEISVSEPSRALAGFSAHGASLRAVAETLAGAEGGWFASSATGLELLSGTGGAVTIKDSGVYAHARTRGRARKRAIAAADAAPRVVSLTHYDPARDYQIGVQRAVRPGPGNREARLELPAAIDAGSAKTIAEAALGRMDAERERRSVTCGWDALAVRPGERVSIEGVPGLWRIDRWTLEAMVVTLDCVALSPGTMDAEASGGRGQPAPAVALGSTILDAVELMPLDGSLASAPRLAIAAAGTEPGWRRAALLTSVDGGARWTSAGTTALPAVIGTIVTAPGVAPAGIEDRANSVEVELAHDAMLLSDADTASLDSGANLAMLGEELIQFAAAEPLGANCWRLSGLWRGRRGTEAAIGTQAEGDRFVLIEAEALIGVALPIEMLGGTVGVLAQGPGDDEAVEAGAGISGRSVVPPSPVHLCWEAAEDGGAGIAWVRRSRNGWRWIDGADAPLGEESERYRVTIASGGSERVIETVTASAGVTPEERAAGAVVSVRQMGSHGLSRPASITLEATE